MDGVNGFADGVAPVEKVALSAVSDGASAVALEPCGFFNTVSATLAGTLENTVGLVCDRPDEHTAHPRM